jgi:hypothetical protein
MRPSPAVVNEDIHPCRRLAILFEHVARNTPFLTIRWVLTKGVTGIFYDN